MEMICGCRIGLIQQRAVVRKNTQHPFIWYPAFPLFHIIANWQGPLDQAFYCLRMLLGGVWVNTFTLSLWTIFRSYVSNYRTITGWLLKLLITLSVTSPFTSTKHARSVLQRYVSFHAQVHPNYKHMHQYFIIFFRRMQTSQLWEYDVQSLLLLYKG